MPNTIHCPSCRRELRVPTELVDKKVKCPGCGVIFTASPEPEAGPEAPIVLQEESPTEPAEPQPIPPARREGGFEEEAREGYGDEFGYPDRRLLRAQNLSPVKAPAICLLIIGILGLTCGVAGLVLTIVIDPQGMKEHFAVFPPDTRRLLEDNFQKSLEFAKSPIGIAVRLVLMGIYLVLIVSSIAMLIGKMYWLAMAGTILAMVGNFVALFTVGDCCCVLVIPFGIWSLVALSKPEVKSAFD